MGFNDGCPKPMSGQNCTKGGIGPNCDHDEEDGRPAKKLCLDNVDRICAQQMKEDQRQCLVDAIATHRHWELNLPFDSPDRTSWTSAARRFTDRLAETYHDCVAATYRTAQVQCKTVQCYCDLPSCKQPCNYPTNCGMNGYGGGGGSKPKPPPPTYKNESNTIKSAQFQTQSAYGIPIELVYSRAYMPGNLIHTSDPEIVTSASGVTTYDAETNTYTTVTTLHASDYLSFAFGLCAGEIDALSRLWIDQNLVFDHAGTSTVIQETTGQTDIAFYKGTEYQKANARQVKQYGFGKTPAYRSLSYVQVNRFPITRLTSFPQINAEVVKVASKENQEVSSASYADATASRLFKVDPSTKRVWFANNDDVIALDYDTLENVSTESAPNAVNLSATGKIIAYDGATLSLIDPKFGQAYASRPADLSIIKTFSTRALNNADFAFNALVTVSAVGDIGIDYYDDTRSAFISHTNTMNLGGTPPIAAVTQRLKRQVGAITYTDFSMILPRVNAANDAINLVEFIMGTTEDDFDSLFEQGVYETYDIDNSYYAGAKDLKIIGVVPCDTDSTLIFITQSAGRTMAQKWAKTGIVWSTDIPAVTVLDSDPMFREPSAKFCYLGANGNVYALSFADGATSLVTTTTHTAVVSQMYDPETESLTFWTTENKVVRLFLNRVNSEKQSIGEVLRDILKRSDVQNMAVSAEDSTITITGYRSGSLTKGADIIKELIDVYPSSVFDAEALYVQDKGSQPTTTVDLTQTEQQLIYTTDRSVGDTGTATLEYYSDPLFGERVTQTFALPTERSVNYAVISQNFGVIESDLYMRRLAELKVFSAQDGDVATSARLPWSFLVLTAGDYVKLSREFEINQLTIGADNSVELQCVSDQRGKYQEVVTMSSVTPLALNVVGINEDIAMAAPFVVVARPIEGQSAHAAGVYVGATNFWEEFAPITVSETDSASVDTPGPSGKKLAQPAVWGRLITAPVDLGKAHWRTFPDQSFTVQFAESRMADSIVTSARVAGAIDYGYNFLLRSPWTNLVLVGREFIQYKTVTRVDAKTVTFSNLLRARAGTEDFGVHSSGELCVFINKKDYYTSEFPAQSLDSSVMLMSYTGDGRARRNDIPLTTADVLPLQQNHIMRRDVPAENMQSSLHPSNPHVILRGNYRVQNANVLTATRSSIDIPSNLTLCYLLRGEYDSALFEAVRDNTLDFSYVMARGAFSPEQTLSELSETLFNSFIWWASDQDRAVWTPVESLTAVVTEQIGDGFENRTITTWPGKSDYAGRFTRGLS